MTIKLTKKLPTETGFYFVCTMRMAVINIVEVRGKGPKGLYVKVNVAYGKKQRVIVEDLDYYWAKVDQSMFEVVDDES